MKSPEARASNSYDRLKLASQLSSRVQIENVRLLSSIVRLEPSEVKGQVIVTYSLAVEASLDGKHKGVLVFPRFKAKGEVKQKPAPKPVFTIEAAFLLAYRAGTLKGITKEACAAFGETNGIYNAWPYWREYVQNVTGRMGLPPLIVPLFRIGKSPLPAKGKST